MRDSAALPVGDGPRRDALRCALPPLALLALCAVAYLPLATAGWVWDDDSYVTRNPALVAPDALTRIWTPGETPQYYPLVFTSFWIETQLWGFAPFGFHLVNWACHAASAILFWRILRRLGVPAAWLAAALFALHPIQVESVAWVTERKNVLSLLCGLGAFASWLRWTDGARGERARWAWYATSLALFLAALLAKTTAVAFAPALVAVAWWQRRLTPRLLVASVPFFAVGLYLGLVTAHLERTLVGAGGAEFALATADRILIATRAPLFYLWTFVWPRGLAFIYPRWRLDAGDWVQWLPFAAWIAVVAIVIALSLRGRRGALTLLLLFGAALFPALGFFDVYPFRYSFVADHFAYLATIPMSIAVACGLSLAGATLSRATRLAASGILLAVLAALTFVQARDYRDEETLWRATIAAAPGAWMPANNLAGVLLARAGATLEAGDATRGQALAVEAGTLALAASELAPQEFTVWTNLSESLRLRGRLAEALDAARRAEALAPRVADTRWLVGRLLELTGDLGGAIEEYRAALELAPTQARPVEPATLRLWRGELGRALLAARRDAEAAEIYRSILASDPRDASAAATLARIEFSRGNVAEARAAYRLALDAAPDEGLVVRLMPGVVNAMLADPRSIEASRDALAAARWLVERTGRSDPLALVLLARALEANGDLAGARRAIDDALMRAADAPQHVRDEVTRRAAELGERSPADTESGATP